tara:strand:- start:1051 stop:1233 length:183 start_codon:yes stop_codon:yes gene_type:complete
MEAFIAIAVAFGWAYYQISQNNPQQEPTENIKSVFSFFLTLIIGGLILTIIILGITSLFG